MATSPVRMSPDFIIIGGRRCGSTSLYNYLIQHPCVAPALRKEIHYFSTKYHKGLSWYKANFPSTLYKWYFNKTKKKNLITGEASPYYLSNPHAPKRIYQTFPEVKLVALLRNPIERAFSDFKHSNEETLSFDEAIKKEETRLSGEKEKILSDPDYVSISHWTQAYIAQGIYVEQLKNWMEIFPKDQILILKSEDLFSNPENALKTVYKFLNLENFNLEEYKRYNYTDSLETMESSTRKQLEEYFKSHNEHLYEFLGRRFDWN